MTPDWKALRAEFPALANWTYLNTATYGQMPRSAADAMCRHLARRDELACGDYLAWFDDMDAIRESCARLVHCEASDIAFVISASTGLAALIHGLPWQPGDEVLTLDDEFPNQLYVSAVLARFGARLRTVAWPRVLSIGKRADAARGPEHGQLCDRFPSAARRDLAVLAGARRTAVRGRLAERRRAAIRYRAGAALGAVRRRI